MDTLGGMVTTEPLRMAPGHVVRRLHQAYAAAWTRYVDPVLTGPQYAVLMAANAYPDIDQGSIAGRVALDRSTMADVCRRLEDRGLIRRETAPGDGRRKLLYLTETGSEVLATVGERVRRLHEEMLSGDDTAAFLERLNGLVKRWDSLADGPPD